MSWRFIILILLGIGVYYYWKRTQKRYMAAKRHRQDPQTGASATELIQCTKCKTYLAKKSALQYKEHYFCSEKCKNDYQE